MSVRVNLLPRETFAEQEAARQRLLAGVAGLVLLAGLGVVFLLQTNALSDARDERDLAQAELRDLEAREAQLAEFGDLEQRVEEADETISIALASELSFAGILQDIAAVTPTDTAFTSLEATVIEADGPDGGVVRPVVARITLDGESLQGHAPGVERLLIQLDKIASFFDVYVSNTTVDPDDEDEDVAIFTVEVDVGDEARTRRYTDGVPEELR